MTFQVKANGTFSSCCDIKYKQGQNKEHSWDCTGRWEVKTNMYQLWQRHHKPLLLPDPPSLLVSHFSTAETNVIVALSLKSLFFWEAGLLEFTVHQMIPSSFPKNHCYFNFPQQTPVPSSATHLENQPATPGLPWCLHWELVHGGWVFSINILAWCWTRKRAAQLQLGKYKFLLMFILLHLLGVSLLVLWQN